MMMTEWRRPVILLVNPRNDTRAFVRTVTGGLQVPYSLSSFTSCGASFCPAGSAGTRTKNVARSRQVSATDFPAHAPFAPPCSPGLQRVPVSDSSRTKSWSGQWRQPRTRAKNPPCSTCGNASGTIEFGARANTCPWCNVINRSGV